MTICVIHVFDCSSADASKRIFDLSSDGDTCTTNMGWMMLKDYGAATGCSEWDPVTGSGSTKPPYILYSTDPRRALWDSGTVGYADSIAIFLMSKCIITLQPWYSSIKFKTIDYKYIVLA